ncbi:MAG: PH domain-containing protein [Oscillospiraceae bacterium]|nr:PH domain-containing protein [Oscillospiraceae bacterium]
MIRNGGFPRIDFKNASFAKLRKVSNAAYRDLVDKILIDQEQVQATYQGLRDGVVFTNYRLIAINVQGITGKKKDLSSLPYAKVQAFSIETAGVLDLDCELIIWFAGLGQVKLEFTAGSDIFWIGQLISAASL